MKNLKKSLFSKLSKPNMNCMPVSRQLFGADDDAKSSSIIQGFASACEANRGIQGEGTRCTGCETLIVQSQSDKKRRQFFCGPKCIGVNLSSSLRVDAFINHYASPIASALRVKSLSFDGMRLILGFLYDKHLGCDNMTEKYEKLLNTVVFNKLN